MPATLLLVDNAALVHAPSFGTNGFCGLQWNGAEGYGAAARQRRCAKKYNVTAVPIAPKKPGQAN